jgi:hypothetical protein
MAAIDETHQIRKDMHLWEWKVGPTSSPDAQYTFDMPQQFLLFRMQGEVTGTRTLTPTPYPSTSRDTDDPGDAALTDTRTSRRPVYLLQKPGRVVIDVGGASGSVYFNIQCFCLEAQWRGSDLP